MFKFAWGLWVSPWKKTFKDRKKPEKKVKKVGKDRGKVYTTYKGKAKAAKKIQGITCHCLFKCCQKLNESNRRRLFDSFYILGSHDEHNKYLYGLIEKKDIQRHRTQKPFKRHNFTYSICLHNGKHLQVCKKTFCDLHAVGKRRVEKLAEKILSDAILSSDERGWHHNHPKKIKEETKERIKEHIKSFPEWKSHHSQKDNRKRRYLSENLSTSQMYHLYLSKYEPQVSETGVKPQVKEWLYWKIFNEEFNLSFGYPCSNTCKTCDLLQIAIQSSKSDKNKKNVRKSLLSTKKRQAKAIAHYRLIQILQNK